MPDERADQCVFCAMARGESPALIVAENALALAFLDLQPLAEGHCLVIPRRHVPWWDEMNAEESSAVFSLAHDVAGKIRRAFRPEFVALYARGRRVPHTHVFVVPTVSGDPLDRTFGALEALQERGAELADLKDPASRLRAWEQLRDA